MFRKTTSERGATCLTLKGLSKSYGHIRALCDLDAEFKSGEIHAVLGENGAGKSTLMAILAGFVVPDSGTVQKSGIEHYPLGEPFALRHLGVELIHQHFTLVPGFTVAENLGLSALENPTERLDIDQRAAEATDLAKSLGWTLDTHKRVEDLPVGAQQRLEILKALLRIQRSQVDQPILLLDEPTAVLTPHEVDDLFALLRKLAEAGVAVVLIAHKLPEVMSVADRVTVLRRGVLTGAAQLSEVDSATLVRWMVGDLPAVASHDLHPGEMLVEGPGFQIREGEIVGFGGVDGNGQVELAERLAGITPAPDITFSTARTAYIPQDRQADGLALELSLIDNFQVAALGRPDLKFGPFLAPGKVRAWCQGLVKRYSIKIGSLSDPARSLSGGNQQKVILARVLDQHPKFIVAHNPTRGLDIGATRFVHQQLLQAAEEGAGVALFSTDLDELAKVATRIFIMDHGRLIERFEAGALGGLG